MQLLPPSFIYATRIEMIEYRFNSIETRVLGVLIEKRFLTPEYYPLTLNSIIHACNQKSSRDPVMSLTEEEVTVALDGLQEKNIVGHVITSRLGSSKYQYEQGSIAEFEIREFAVLCVLLLRGPQTLGQIRSRSDRIYHFSGLAEVSGVIEKLAKHENGPFAVRLEREPGRKEHRYAHLLSDSPVISSAKDVIQSEPEERVSHLEGRLDLLERDVLEIKQQLQLVLDSIKR